MKTKIIMMTALLALLATGCGKDKFNGFRIVAENMQVVSNSKLLMNPTTMASEWLANEKIMINDGNLYNIIGDAGDYSIGAGETTPLADESGFYYALYPGDDFGGNDVTVDNSTPAEPSIILNELAIDMLSNGSHHVAFPMGAKMAAGGTTMNFKHLTAAFRLTLHATTATSLTKLKVYVYGSAAQPKVTVDDIDGVEYLVKWNNEGAAPNLPIGPVGEVTDQDIKYGSEMVFNLTGMTFNDGDDMTFCIPVTVANVKRISVVGYNGSTQVFAKTSALSTAVPVTRNKVYPVATININ